MSSRLANERYLDCIRKALCTKTVAFFAEPACGGHFEPRTHEFTLRCHRRQGMILQVRRGRYCAVLRGKPDQSSLRTCSLLRDDRQFQSSGTNVLHAINTKRFHLSCMVVHKLNVSWLPIDAGHRPRGLN